MLAAALLPRIQHERGVHMHTMPASHVACLLVAGTGYIWPQQSAQWLTRGVLGIATGHNCASLGGFSEASGRRCCVMSTVYLHLVLGSLPGNDLLDTKTDRPLA